jgi:hypothetical protein
MKIELNVVEEGVFIRMFNSMINMHRSLEARKKRILVDAYLMF